jgi:sugar phosphate isomerase/epimerase
MQVGFQTISFGRSLENHGRPMLKAIKNMGYEGVELEQHPSEFGSAETLYHILKTDCKGLKLLGLAGGSLEERVRFAQELIDYEDNAIGQDIKKTFEEDGYLQTTERIIRFDIQSGNYPYIYVDSWDEDKEKYEGYKDLNFAISNHMFTPALTAREVTKILETFPRLHFLPDTAHFLVAGDNTIDVLYEHYYRIIAMHLMDWTSEFGRSYQFYSRGFGVEFGQGDVDLNSIINFLKDPSTESNRQDFLPYDKWIVIMQDIVPNPLEAAKACRNWLRNDYDI